MKQVLSLFMLVCAAVAFIWAPAHAEDVLDVNDVLKGYNPETMTKVQFKEYYASVKGKTARGKGKVVDVAPGRRGYKITILTSVSNPPKGYNVVLYGKGEAPTDLNKGTVISFEGTVGRFSTFRGVSVDIHGTYAK